MIAPQRIQEIAALVASHGLDEPAVQRLRAAFPEIHFTYCRDDDLGIQEPALRGPGFNLYLVDGREHCLRFTHHPEHATGLVLAVLEDEEEP
jgi:hypothetical protein